MQTDRGRGGIAARLGVIVAMVTKPESGATLTDDPVELEPLAREGLIPVKTPATCPSWNPDEAIDRVYIRGDWEIVSGSVPDIHLSDHLPVVVILKLRDPLPQVTADQTEPVSSAPSPAP